MKVQSLVTNNWLTEDEVYSVLEVSWSADILKYRIQTEEGATPALHPSHEFRVVDTSIPPSWVIDVADDGKFFGLTPRSWAVKGFWEAYFDQDHDAWNIFQNEAKQMLL